MNEDEANEMQDTRAQKIMAHSEEAEALLDVAKMDNTSFKEQAVFIAAAHVHAQLAANMIALAHQTSVSFGLQHIVNVLDEVRGTLAEAARDAEIHRAHP